MNIQINCTDNVDENDLRYIYYNLQDYIKKYQETWNDSNYLKFKGYNRIWTMNAGGSFMIKPKIEIRCNGKTMYFKIKENKQ